MKKYLLIFFCAFACSLYAKPNAVAMIAKMESLHLQHQYIEAMDTAVRVLVEFPNNRIATNYVHDHWDEMIKYANQLMEDNSDELSIEQSLVRLETCRLLADISDNMRGVDMPLYGPNQSWAWYPEMYYSQGDYDAERVHIYQLLVSYAEQSLKSYDVDGAQKYYKQALTFLYPGKEMNGNVATLSQTLYQKIISLSNAPRIPDAIFAYELTTLSLTLNPQQPEVEALQPQIAQHVADLYLLRESELREQGDSIKAHDYHEYALDWCTTNCPE